MFKVEQCKSYKIVNEQGIFLHSDGTKLPRGEFWPTEELAQAVLDKFQLMKHVWVRGDVVRCYDGAIVICVQRCGQPIRIFGVGTHSEEYETNINLSKDAKFLFNIKDKLKDFNG